MSVPHDQNTQIITVTMPLSNGASIAQLPVPGTSVDCDNPNIQVGLHDAGACEIYATRLAAGPLSGNVIVTVNGVASMPHPVVFDGVPVPTLLAVNLEDARTGNR